MNNKLSILQNWLFNPFKFIGGEKSLLIGSLFILISGIAGWANGTHFDGLIDIHQGKRMSIVIHLSEGFINVLIISILLYLAGVILSKSKIRFIDVAGNMAYARFPYLLPVLLGFLPLDLDEISKRINNSVVQNPMKPEFSGDDLALLLIISLVTLTVTVWYISLMWKAYVVSVNLKGTKAVISFILAVVLAEVSSKIAIAQLFSLTN
jgi:hypothetical protein